MEIKDLELLRPLTPEEAEKVTSQSRPVHPVTQTEAQIFRSLVKNISPVTSLIWPGRLF